MFKILEWKLSKPGEDVLDKRIYLIIIGSKVIAGLGAWIRTVKFRGIILSFWE